MSNPSTVWTQLSLGMSSIGSLPFVDTDSVSIITDVAHFSYTAANSVNISTVAGSTNPNFAAYQLSVWGGIRVGYVDGTPLAPAQNITINAPMGKFIIPAGQTQVTINSSYVFTNSVVLTQIDSLDPTLTKVGVANYGTGSFSCIGNANATNPVIVRFVVFNPFPSGGP